MVMRDQKVRHGEQRGVHDAGGPAAEEHGCFSTDGAQGDHTTAVGAETSDVDAFCSGIYKKNTIILGIVVLDKIKNNESKLQRSNACVMYISVDDRLFDSKLYKMASDNDRRAV